MTSSIARLSFWKYVDNRLKHLFHQTPKWKADSGVVTVILIADGLAFVAIGSKFSAELRWTSSAYRVRNSIEIEVKVISIDRVFPFWVKLFTGFGSKSSRTKDDSDSGRLKMIVSCVTVKSKFPVFKCRISIKSTSLTSVGVGICTDRTWIAIVGTFLGNNSDNPSYPFRIIFCARLSDYLNMSFTLFTACFSSTCEDCSKSCSKVYRWDKSSCSRTFQLYIIFAIYHNHRYFAKHVEHVGGSCLGIIFGTYVNLSISTFTNGFCATTLISSSCVELFGE